MYDNYKLAFRDNKGVAHVVNVCAQSRAEAEHMTIEHCQSSYGCKPNPLLVGMPKPEIESQPIMA
jgi:hypothetical protein